MLISSFGAVLMIFLISGSISEGATRFDYLKPSSFMIPYFYECVFLDGIE